MQIIAQKTSKAGTIKLGVFSDGSYIVGDFLKRFHKGKICVNIKFYKCHNLASADYNRR